MNIPFGLELHSFWTNDPEQMNAADLGIPVDAEDLQTKSITFFTIDHIRDMGEYCDVVSGGIEYTINESKDSVIAKIREALTYKWN